MPVYEITKKHLERMCIPKTYWYCKLAEIPDECPHKKLLEKYVSKIEFNVNEGHGLLLWGDYGQGKTGLTSIILKAGASVGIIGLWIRAANVIKYVMEKVRFDANETMLERAYNVDLLVLDELVLYGDDRQSDTVIENLIRERINEKKTTIITTNLNPAGLREKYPALSNVLQESVFPIRVSGHNFRQDLAADIAEDMAEK